jgi:arginine decarboxylase-like protein
VLEVYNCDENDENNLQAGFIVGSLQFYMSEIVCAHNQFITRNILDSSGQPNGEMLIRAIGQTTEVCEVSFKVKFDWDQKHSKIEQQTEPDYMFFVVEKTLISGETIPIYYSKPR